MNIAAIIAALLTVAGTLSIALGHPALGVLFNDPSTANEVTAVITAVSGLVSAFAPALHKAVPAVAAAAVAPAAK